MSSKLNKAARSGNQSKKVKSISRRLARRRVSKKIGASFSKKILLLVVICVTWLAALEFAATGRLFNRVNDYSMEFDEEAYEESTESYLLSRRLGAVKYTVVDKDSGEVLVSTYPFKYGGIVISALTGIFLIQLLAHWASYPFENASVKKILKPLDNLAAKADELARFDLSDNKYDLTGYQYAPAGAQYAPEGAGYAPAAGQYAPADNRYDPSDEKYRLLENKINSLAPDDEQLISLGDEDLAGIEKAMNSLLIRIRENNKQQARFVNDASHELRTPIAVIQGYANMLARWGREDEKVLDESITAIQNESENMKHLVEQLLFLARGDAGRTQLTIAPVSLNMLMGEVYEESLMIDEKHIYRLNLPEEDVMVNGDEGLLKQAVRILVDNAAKYTKEKDEIILGVGVRPDNSVYLRVQDSGIGMKENDVAHMFERFYRADEARTYNGTGLGLSIAKWIIDKHGGYFEVTSREELGTRIDILLSRTF